MRRRFQHPQSEVLDRFIQAPGKDAVPVVEQVAMACLVTNHLAQLLQRPVGAGVFRHAEVQHPARIMMDHHQHVEQPERRCDRDEDQMRR
jgi:hypothetical protein